MSKKLKALLWGSWTDVHGKPDLPAEDRAKLVRWTTNRIYSVRVFADTVPLWGSVTVLSICRRDGQPVRAWPDLQRIKDEIVGEDRTAIEIYPPRDEIVDPAPVYYLWVLPPGKVLPIGLRHPSKPETRTTARYEDTVDLVDDPGAEVADAR